MENEKKGYSRKTTVILIAIVLLVGVFRFCNIISSSQMTERYLTALRIHTLPEKRIYLAGMDTELNFTGGELCYTAGYDLHLVKDDTCGGEDCDIILSMAKGLENIERVSVYTDADFTIPGTYTVTFRSAEDYGSRTRMLSCSFPIEVIDPASLE